METADVFAFCPSKKAVSATLGKVGSNDVRQKPEESVCSMVVPSGFAREAAARFFLDMPDTCGCRGSLSCIFPYGIVNMEGDVVASHGSVLDRCRDGKCNIGIVGVPGVALLDGMCWGGTKDG